MVHYAHHQCDCVRGHACCDLESLSSASRCSISLFFVCISRRSSFTLRSSKSRSAWERRKAVRRYRCDEVSE